MKSKDSFSPRTWGVLFCTAMSLKNAVNFIQYMCDEKCDWRECFGFYWKALPPQINVVQWEFVRLFVLSSSGDVSCFALFKPRSYILYIYYLILCSCVLSHTLNFIQINLLVWIYFFFHVNELVWFMLRLVWPTWLFLIMFTE